MPSLKRNIDQVSPSPASPVVADPGADAGPARHAAGGNNAGQADEAGVKKKARKIRKPLVFGKGVIVHLRPADHLFQAQTAPLPQPLSLPPPPPPTATTPGDIEMEGGSRFGEGDEADVDIGGIEGRMVGAKDVAPENIPLPFSLPPTYGMVDPAEPLSSDITSLTSNAPLPLDTVLVPGDTSSGPNPLAPTALDTASAGLPPQNPPLLSHLRVQPGQVVRTVRSFFSNNNSQIMEVELGRMGDRRNDRLHFVRDEGVPNLAMKVIQSDLPVPSPRLASDAIQPDNDPIAKSIDALEQEFTMSKKFLAKNAEVAEETLVPIYCYAYAGYEKRANAEIGASWLGEESVRVILMPLHIPFSEVLKSPSYTEDEKVALFKNGYEKIVKFNNTFQHCHRDIKSDNAVVRAAVNPVNGELEPVRPLDLLLIDYGAAQPSGRPLQFAPRTGTAVFASITVVEGWFYDWFDKVSKHNPLINPPVGWKVDLADPSTIPVWKDLEAKKYLAQLGQDQRHPIDPANDTWAWGMSLLDYLDTEYVKRVGFPEGKYHTFCKSFPGPAEKGKKPVRPMDYQYALALWDDLKTNYAPIYDRKTYRLELNDDGVQISMGCVPEKWWKLMEKLLARPSFLNAHSTTADPKDAEITEAQFDTLANPPLSTDLAASTSTTTSAAQAVSRMRITPDRAAVVAAMSEAELKAKRSTYTTTKVYPVSVSPALENGVLIYRLPPLPKAHYDDIKRCIHQPRHEYVCGLSGCNGEGTASIFQTWMRLKDHVNKTLTPAGRRAKRCSHFAATDTISQFRIQVFNVDGSLRHDSEEESGAVDSSGLMHTI